MIRAVLDDLFSKEFLDDHPDEWGIVEHCDQPTSLGYSTTITPRTIYEAVDRRVDVIATHHDAWKFMFEQREAVYGLLQDKGLTHIWAHLPLDLADFGTASTLLAKIGCHHVYKPSAGEARIGKLPAPTSSPQSARTTRVDPKWRRRYSKQQSASLEPISFNFVQQPTPIHPNTEPQ